jgi:Tir chaperone protein (CesT) family
MVYRDPFEMVNDYILRFAEEVGTSIAPLDAGGYTDARHGALVVGINAVREHRVLVLLVRMGDVPETNKQRLYRKLLELNFLATAECAFAIDDQREAVYLRTMRALEGLDYVEFRDLMEHIASVADKVHALLPELAG